MNMRPCDYGCISGACRVVWQGLEGPRKSGCADVDGPSPLQPRSDLQPPAVRHLDDAAHLQDAEAALLPVNAHEDPIEAVLAAQHTSEGSA